MHAEGSNSADGKPVETTPVEARQGTGPRVMVSVLIVSLSLAVAAGAILLAFFWS